MNLQEANDLLKKNFPCEYTWADDCVQGVKLEGSFSAEDLREIAEILDSLDKEDE